MAGKAEVYHNESTTPQQICDWITSLGFASSILNQDTQGDLIKCDDGTCQVEVHIRGMTCSSCVYSIESNLMKVNGVVKARVALSTQRGVINYNPDIIGPRKVIDCINVSLLYIVSLNVKLWSF